MSIQQAASIVYGNSPTSAAELDVAREVLRKASTAGYRFSTTGRISAPYQNDDDADNDERRYAEAMK